MFHPLSLVIPALMLLPNMFFVVKQPTDSAPDSVKEPLYFVIPEKLGQIGAFLGPLFFSLDISVPLDILAVSVMSLILGSYYFCWIRYFRSRKRLHLFSPLLSIPVPMAVSPVIYFLLSSVILNSWLVFSAALVLATGHIPITYLHYRALVKPN